MATSKLESILRAFRGVGAPRGLLGQSFAKDSFGSTVNRGAGLLGCVGMRGLWQVENRAPVRVSDPEKFFALAVSGGLLLPANRWRSIFQAGIAPVKACDELASRLSLPGRRELEALCSGAGLLWRNEFTNLVVNAGLDHLLDVTLSGGTQDTSWFVGLLATSPSPAAGWTATEIASNDFVNYDEADLQAFTDGGVSGQSLSNTASKATFTISTNGSTIGGAYLIATNAKATPAGTLYAAGAFSGGDKSADDGDTLQVTATFTAAAA